MTQFLCERGFKDEPFANQEFKSDCALPTNLHETDVALSESQLVIAAGAPLADCPCQGLQGPAVPKATFLRDGPRTQGSTRC
ncbi:MAG TPA: hypothetical protein VHG72_15590 [Polyangia bacterium]|nr:hypothetical protein [Polyangia bacterium]